MSTRAPSPTCYHDQSLTVTHLVYLVPGIPLAIITLLGGGGFDTHHIFEALNAIFQKVTLFNSFVDSYIFYSLINKDRPPV